MPQSVELHPLPRYVSRVAAVVVLHCKVCMKWTRSKAKFTIDTVQKIGALLMQIKRQQSNPKVSYVLGS